MKKLLRTLTLMAVVLLTLGMIIGAGDVKPAPAGTPATQPASAMPAAAGVFSQGLPSGANVAIIPIEGMIYDFTLETLKRKAERARLDGATLLVLEINTDGGLVASALDISREIKLLGLPTVAWINRKAYSAGILIASACDAIVMNPYAATGDCAPIVPGMSLSPTERAKALSPLLTEFRTNARRNNYEYAVLHAMCELQIEVHLIEHRTTGQRRLVNQADKRVMVDGETIDAVQKTLSQMAASNAQNALAAPAPQPAPQPAAPGNPSQPNAPNLPTLPTIPGTGAPALAPGVGPSELPGLGIDSATDADVGQWKAVKQLHDGRTLLTVNAKEAVDFGLSKGEAVDEAALSRLLAASNVKTYSMSIFETIGAFLTTPIVRGILILIMLVGAYLEAQSPGLIIPGTLAGIALVLLLAGPFMAGLGEVWHLIVIAIGIGLIIFELFMPTFGLVGVIGVILLLGGLVLSIIPTARGMGLPPAEMWGRVVQSIVWAMTAFVLSVIGAGLITHYMGSLPVFRKFVHHNPENMALHNAQGAAALSGAGVMSEPLSGGDAVGGGKLAVGMTGQSSTQLRPGGRAIINGSEVDVETLGSWVDVGAPVRIIEVAGNRIVVEKA